MTSEFGWKLLEVGRGSCVRRIIFAMSHQSALPISLGKTTWPHSPHSLGE
jgi:hypothetical protein